MSTIWQSVRRSAAVVGTSLLLSSAAFGAGLMTPAGGNLPELEIKQHHVNVVIDDGYAITTVDQVFYNSNNTALEAIYSFPVPEKASVGEFTYWIDGKPVTGEVLEKKAAREIYEQEKAQGRETALTEKNGYKTFDSSVYPVKPKQSVKIRLVYIQPVHVDHGIGNYVYPLEEGGTDEEKLAFWNYNDAVTEAFSFHVSLRSSYPIEGVRLPKHPHATAISHSSQEWEVSLANSTAVAQGISADPLSDGGSEGLNTRVNEGENKTAGSSASNNVTTSGPQIVQSLDQDIVVYWRHQQGLPGSVDMIVHKEPNKSRGTFMMTVTPGDDLAKINQGRDWIFVLDLSGSMSGKYQSLVEGVNKGLANLNPNDRFRVILFNDRAREITSGYTAATPENVHSYTQKLESTQTGGGTNLYAGLKKAINGLDADRASAVILVTDGVANVGVTEKKDFLTLLESNDVRLFTFVMGNSANRPLLNGMTKISNGFAMSVSNSDDIVGKLLLATEKLTHEAFHDVDINIDGVKVKDLTPDRIGSVYRGQQLIVFGHYWGDGLAKVSVSGKVAGQQRAYTTEFEFPKEGTLHPEIERLWAYASIEDLQHKMDYLGEDADTKQALVDLAKEYSLVTNYTSMIVVREEVFQQHNIERNNAKRVAKEEAARNQRAAAPVRNNRKDAHNPAFKSPRSYPSGGGGGAAGPWVLLMFLPLLFVGIRNRVYKKASGKKVKRTKG